MHKFTSEKQKIGRLGEEIAHKYLIKHNYSILEQNYTRKCGEVDIIAYSKISKEICFFEVKSIILHRDVLHETRGSEYDFAHNSINKWERSYNPMENVTRLKKLRLYRTANLYLKDIKYYGDKWKICFLSVKISMQNRIARVEYFEDFEN